MRGKFLLVTAAAMIALVSCSGNPDNSGETAQAEQTLPEDGRAVLKDVSQHKWSGWGLDCNVKPAFRITYDAEMGQMVFSDGLPTHKSTDTDNIEFSYEFSGASFIFHQKVYSTVNLTTGELLVGESRPLKDDITVKVSMISPDSIKVEQFSKTLDADKWETSGSLDYDETSKVSTESKCE